MTIWAYVAMFWVAGQSVAVAMKPRKQKTHARGSVMERSLKEDWGAWTAKDWPSSWSRSVRAMLSTSSSFRLKCAPDLIFSTAFAGIGGSTGE